MKSIQQDEESNIADNIPQDVVPIKRKRGRPPSKNKNSISDNKKPQRALETHHTKLQIEGKRNLFQYPPQIAFTGFDLDQNLRESSISTRFFRNIIDKILGLWWTGSSPVLVDDTKIMKYELVYNIFRFMKYIFDPLPPILLITSPEYINHWLSTFIRYHSYLFTDNEDETNSDVYYTNKSKVKLDVLILSNDQDYSNFALTNFSLLIIDQPTNFDNLSYFENSDIKSHFLICNSATENIPSIFDFENHILITLEDMKINRYVSETLHFCPMTQFQIIQTQQLFKSNKSRLHQIPEPPPERFTMFFSHMVQQVKSISVHPSLSEKNNAIDDLHQSGKFQELLKIVENLQKNENKIAIIGQDPKLLKFTGSFFIQNKINAYVINHSLKGKKKAQLIEEYNQSDSSSLLLIDPENFFEFHIRLIIDKIIVLEVDIGLNSMIDEIFTWQQTQHDNAPQIIRLITDNSIEMPIYEMQFNQVEEIENENENENESKKDVKRIDPQNQFFDFDRMKSETLLLLLKQSASLCFESDIYSLRKPMEVCYTHSPDNLFNIDTEFNQNFWNDITQIDFQHQENQLQKSQQKNSSYNKHSFSRGSNQQKLIDTNSEDNLSIATRVKKQMLRRARMIDQEKPEKVKSKISARNSSKKASKTKSLKTARKKNAMSIDYSDVEEESEYDLSDNESTSKSKLRKSNKASENENIRSSPRLKKMKKYTENDQISDYEQQTDNEDDEDDDENEEEYEYESNKKKEADSDEDDDDVDDDEEEEEQNEADENENEIQIQLGNEAEESENDENESIASREKKRLKKIYKLRSQLQEIEKATKLTKSSKKSKKISKKSQKASSKRKKSSEQKQQQQQQQQLQQNLQKPRKHIPKFDAMVNFWTRRHFAHYLEILRDYGFDRWDKFTSFERSIQELRKIGALIIRNLETTSRENRILREYFANELRSSELSRLDSRLPFVRRKLAKINRAEFLAELTGMLLITKLAPKSPKDVILPKAAYEIEPLDPEWTEEDDKQLVFLIYENGLFNIPQTFKHNLSKNFIKRFRTFFLVDPTNPNSPNIVSLTVSTAGPLSKVKSENSQSTSSSSSNSSSFAKSSISSLKRRSNISPSSKSKSNKSTFDSSPSSRPIRGIDQKTHVQIVQALCMYGFPNLFKFKSQLNNLPNIVSDGDLEDYIETIFSYCTSTVKEERRVLAEKLAGKIEKYTASKIISRKLIFEKLRKDAVNYDEISAEDTELLAAIGFHGFANTETSPVLLCSCGGDCSDKRLLQRVKAISVQEQIHNQEKIEFFMKQAREEKKKEEMQQQQLLENSMMQQPQQQQQEQQQEQEIQPLQTLDSGHQINEVAQSEIQNSQEVQETQETANYNAADEAENANVSFEQQQQQEQHQDQQHQLHQELNQEQQHEHEVQQPFSELNDQVNQFELGSSDVVVVAQEENLPDQHPQDTEPFISPEPDFQPPPPPLPEPPIDHNDPADSPEPNIQPPLAPSSLDPVPEDQEEEDGLFPLKLNDRQMLISIGEIDPRFHDEDYIYPVGYESCVACTNPFNDSSNLVWLNLSIRLLNTRLDKTDRSNKNGDLLNFVIRKETEKSSEISDDSPDKVFEKVRQRIIRKTKTWIPPFDGNEMFGFNSSKVHRILLESPNIELCTRYRKRFFRLPMTIEHEWPILGRYEDKKKQLLMYSMFTENINQNKGLTIDDHLSVPASSFSSAKKAKTKLKSNKVKNAVVKGEKSYYASMLKKDFKNLMKPLVINCKPLLNSEMEEASACISGSSVGFCDLMKRYEEWDREVIQRFLPSINLEGK